MGSERVAQKDHQVDHTAGDECADLEVVAMRPRGRPPNTQWEGVLDQAAGRLGRDQARVA